MKIPYSIIILVHTIFGLNTVRAKPEDPELKSTISIYDFKVKSIDGEIIDFSKYKGKKILIVNTASRCGYTPQYAELQKLYDQYGSKLVILGFPSNDFREQEPGTNEEIKSFCQKNYGVTFQLFEKVTVKGKGKHPVYEWLTSKEKNGWNEQEPTWNFSKYLINENGELVKYYSPAVSPLSKEIVDAIK